MAREDVDVVRAAHEAAARGDAAAVLERYSPDVVWDISGGPLAELAGETVYRGHDGLRAFFRSWREALEDAEHVLEDIFEAGERVVTVGHLRGRGRSSGLQLEGRDQAAVWTVRGGRIVHVAWFASRGEALAAVD